MSKVTTWDVETIEALIVCSDINTNLGEILMCLLHQNKAFIEAVYLGSLIIDLAELQLGAQMEKIVCQK